MFYQFLLVIHCVFVVWAVIQLVIVAKKIIDQHWTQSSNNTDRSGFNRRRLHHRHSVESVTANNEPGSSVSHTNNSAVVNGNNIGIVNASDTGDMTAQRESPMPPPTRLYMRSLSSASTSFSSLSSSSMLSRLSSLSMSLSLRLSSMMSCMNECITCELVMRKVSEFQLWVSELHGITALVMVTNMLVLLICVLTVYHSMLFVLALSNRISCKTQIYLGPPIYSFCKGTMYMIFLLRIQTMVHRSSFAYSKLLMHSLFAITIVGTLLLCVLMPLFTEVEERRVYTNANSIQHCQINPSLLIGISVVIFDLVMSVTCLHLFTKPLNKLYEMDRIQGRTLPSSLSSGSSASRMSRNDHINSNLPIVSESQIVSVSIQLPQQTDYGSMMKKIASKFRLLTWTAIISTFINISLNVVFDFNYCVVFELIVTDLCVIFMAAWFDEYYGYICCLPLWVERVLEGMKSSLCLFFGNDTDAVIGPHS